MRAAFMTAVDAVEVREDVAPPELDPGGAVLRVEACGICGTDARTFFNGDPKAPPPWQLGHEPGEERKLRLPADDRPLARAHAAPLELGARIVPRPPSTPVGRRAGAATSWPPHLVTTRR